MGGVRWCEENVKLVVFGEGGVRMLVKFLRGVVRGTRNCVRLKGRVAN